MWLKQHQLEQNQQAEADAAPAQNTLILLGAGLSSPQQEQFRKADAMDRAQ